MRCRADAPGVSEPVRYDAASGLRPSAALNWLLPHCRGAGLRKSGVPDCGTPLCAVEEFLCCRAAALDEVAVGQGARLELTRIKVDHELPGPPACAREAAVRRGLW